MHWHSTLTPPPTTVSHLLSFLFFPSSHDYHEMKLTIKTLQQKVFQVRVAQNSTHIYHLTSMLPYVDRCRAYGDRCGFEE